MNKNKKSVNNIDTKIIVTFFIYIALLCLSAVWFYIKANINSGWVYNNFDVIIQWILFVGVSWVISIFNSSKILFFFPFAPIIVSLLVIFIIVNILEKWKIITKNIGKFFIFIVISITLFFATIIFDLIRQEQDHRNIIDDKKYYEQTYKTYKTIESESLFTYSEDNKIIVSDIYGNNIKNIYLNPEENINTSLNNKNITIGYISPDGKYFANCDWYKYGNCNLLLSSKDSSKKIDLCIMGIDNDNKVCPDFCDWDSSWTSFVCKYNFYGFINKNKEEKPSSKNILVLFNPVDEKYKIITERNKGSLGVIQDFALVDKNTLIFLNQDKFYKAENIYSCQMKISEIKNLSECDSSF